MTFKILTAAAALLWLWGTAFLPPDPVWAAGGARLAERHKGHKIDCSGCHKENPPKQKVPMAACLGCHGDYGKVAARTGRLDPNPHDSHLGAYDCGKCHHAHRASENACAACHSIEMKVP
jgi:Zn finger protein HypA/HybF involved in hydrogenase expression